MIDGAQNKSIVSLFLGFFALLFLHPPILKAQFIDLNLDVEAEVTVHTEQSLNFGTLIANTGTHTVDLGNPNMGIFSIKALENQEILIELDEPDELQHNDPEIDDSIPLKLFARYGYSFSRYQQSNLLPGRVANILMEENPAPGPWNVLYLYIYGNIEVNDITDGVYTAQIVLNVEYL